MSKAIAVVEDDESIREMLRYYFQSVGYAVRAYESGEALFAGEEGLGLPALYILDIMLPGMDGLEILRRLREGRDTADVPVIMLTARSAEMDRVAGLENGADDYVVKPFGIMELQARVKAVLRRTERRGDRVLTWGDVELDPAAREVHKAGKPVELTYKEFELLKLLFSRRGVALTRDEILQAVWDYDYTGETRTVDMHVKALRQKLGEDIITTVRGVGYKMVCRPPGGCIPPEYAAAAPTGAAAIPPHPRTARVAARRRRSGQLCPPAKYPQGAHHIRKAAKPPTAMQ